jgi:hypothetical protein
LADSYELQYVVDSDFENSENGLSWQDIRLSDHSWLAFEALLHTWSSLTSLGIPVEITTINGPGFTTLGLDSGLTWSEIGSYESNWDSFSNLKTWEEIDFLNSVGLSWNSIDSKQHSWDSSNLSLDDTYILWDWDYLESLASDISLHKGFSLTVPSGEYMRFRLRSSVQDSFSNYLVTSKEFIIKQDVIEWYAGTGEVLAIHLDSELIRSHNAEITLYYTSNTEVVKINNKPKSIKNKDGSLAFEKDQYIKLNSLAEDEVITVHFKALQTGMVRIITEYVNKE